MMITPYFSELTWCRVFRFLLFITMFGVPARAELIPPARKVVWTAGVTTGVIGGIPTDRTLYKNAVTEGADNTGATDALPVIQRLVNECPPGQYVYLPAGTYRISGAVTSPMRKSNFTVRGAGMGKTILDLRDNNGFNFGSGSDYEWKEPPGDNRITGGLVKGSTILTIANTSAFSEGQICRISFQNQYDDDAIRAGGVPAFNNNGDPTEVRRQMVRIVSKSPTTLTIFPGIYHEPQAGLGARINHARIISEGVGIEDITLNCENSSVLYGIVFDQCYNSWVKNVEVKRAYNYPFFFMDSLNCEIRGSYANEGKVGGSNGAGILVNASSACLFEDNIVLKCFPGIEVNQGASGNVFAYNLLESSVSTIATMNINHGPHNSHNLYEGNIAPMAQSDGYFGGASEDTLFRNWLTGTNYRKEVFTAIVSLNRFVRNYSLIGNVLGVPEWPHGSTPYSFGNPNMGNSSFEGTAAPSKGLFWRDWKATATLVTRSSNSQGTFRLNSGSIRTGQFRSYLQWPGGGTEVVSPVTKDGVVATFTAQIGTPHVLPPEGTVMKFWGGIQGFQDKDLDVELSTILKANHHAWAGGGLGIPEKQALGNDPLPESLFRSEKPAYFGDLAWPPFDPFKAEQVAYDRIPAGYRYVHGTNPPGVISDATAPTAPQNLAAVVSGPTQIELKWLPSSDNVSVMGYRLERSKGTDSTAFVQVAAPGETSFTDTGVVAATVYNYRVRAVDAAGNVSTFSNVATGTTTAAPKSPRNLRIIP